jgi:CheY-like chemotaxis protein
MDHMMPGLDGIETTRLIRESGYFRPIVALTANVIEGQKEIFLENGFDGVISKPIDIKQLDAVLNELIRDKKPPEVVEESRRLGNIPAEKQNTTTNPATVYLTGERNSNPLAPLKRISGLDVDSALDAMSGMTDVYLDTIKLTVRLLPERIAKMDRFLESDIKSFTVEVHGLKSVLKSIGAAAPGNSAALLEHAALKNDISYCTEFYPAFKAGLLELTDSLNAALQPKTTGTLNKPAGRRSSLAELIAKVKAAAESFDRDQALEIMAPCADFAYGTETDKLVKEVIFALEAFDCEKALHNIARLEENFNETERA